MQKQQLESLKNWFTQYVAGFYSSSDDFLNSNIQLKECHTHRVCKEMRELAAALSMNECDSLVAETIALLHDVGRFPQFKKYRTYKDQISEDHCLLALKVLSEQEVLAGVDDDRAVIEKAIEFHGAKEIPAMDERAAHFTKMIRDADKIDIFELLVENYRLLADDPDNFPWEVEYPDTPECGPVIINAIINQELIDYRQLRTVNDAKLLQLGWVYDVYFDYSLKQIHDRGYLQAIIDLLPETNEVRQATQCVLGYTQKRIQTIN